MQVKSILFVIFVMTNNVSRLADKYFVGVKKPKNGEPLNYVPCIALSF
jgi:hypothetical protein